MRKVAAVQSVSMTHQAYVKTVSAAELHAAQLRSFPRLLPTASSRTWRCLQQTRNAAAKRDMRRAPSLTNSRSRVGHSLSTEATDEHSNNAEPDNTSEFSLAQTSTGKGQTMSSISSNFTIMGLKPSPELVSISMGEAACCALGTDIGTLLTGSPVAVYFVQGILGLARLAISFFYKDEFHLDPATVGMHDARHLLPALGCPVWQYEPFASLHLLGEEQHVLHDIYGSIQGIAALHHNSCL